ncbi:hypothetical protein EX342_18300, partial [Bacillus paralicheniformis]
LKKLANWTWKSPIRQHSHRKNRINWTKIGRIIKIRPILSTVWKDHSNQEWSFFMQFFSEPLFSSSRPRQPKPD